MPLPNVTGPRIAINRMLNAHVPRVALPQAGGLGAAPHIPAAHFPHPHLGRAAGGIVDSPAAPFTGPIVTHGAGRSDDVPMHVPNGAYVIPADIVSHIGDGNSLAGHKLLTAMFGAPWHAQGAPWGATSPPLRHGPGVHPPAPPPVRGFPSFGVTAGGGTGLAGVQHARGGAAHGGGKPVPIMASGGEFVIPPEEVQRRGGGDIDKGHKALDHWVMGLRKQAITTLKKLPGPAK